MSSTFFGLTIAGKALSAQQIALNITGHNIANADTEGYSRQQVNMTTTYPYTVVASGKNMSQGSGVTIDTIMRARNAFVDKQLRSETSTQEYWGAKETGLSEIESAMNEPTDYSLSSDLSNFWNSWNNLADNPEDSGTRSILVQRTLTLTDSLHAISDQFTEMEANLNTSVNNQITDINDYTDQIAELNKQIKRAEITGDTPNDLYDNRDLLVDKLSKIVNVTVTEGIDGSYPNGKVNTYDLAIGEPPQTLVSDAGVVKELKEVTTTDGSGNPIKVLQLDGTILTLGNNMGSLQADRELRDTYLPDLQGKYDTLAAGIASAVNSIYGTTTKFFTTSDSSTTITASNITSSVAAADIVAGDGTSGDGSVAAAIAALSEGWSSISGTDLDGFKAKYGSSLVDSYSATVAKLGADLQQATRMKKGQEALVANLTTQKETVSGVSLDEEMINLTKYQKSYSAAARLVTMMDDLLDTLLGMGMTK
ncbi:flagellar hook-associated protein FlgK [Desulfosporosinus sp. BG]|uniref:flagellar hook-associated protein FlgK n=1 Tax=Desulfosporosinus sp. BG TaxID=1633135 RepID=UPI00083ABF0F|nr:flagellar hook-associated protein FlgK [Desulfosporosinus sp. BG]ODA42538.1 Flagellar hook-associated protein FlgK [Desulfosporosinus sp. BG]